MSFVSISTASDKLAFLKSNSAAGVAQDAQTTDVATTPLTFTPQAPYASATGANRTPGYMVVALASPTNGGSAEGFLQITRGGSHAVSIGPAVNNSAYDGMYFGPGITPSSTNYTLITNGDGDTRLNVPNSAGTLSFGFAGTLKGQFAGATNGMKWQDTGNNTLIEVDATAKLGFFNAAPVVQQQVTGALSTVADAPAKAVLTSIIAKLVALGLITDGTT